MNNATEILDSVKHMAAASSNWSDLSNFLFNPVDGLVVKTGVATHAEILELL